MASKRNTEVKILQKTLRLLETEAKIKEEELALLQDSIRIIKSHIRVNQSALISTTEVIAILGVTKTTLGRYHQGLVPNGKPPFPKAVARDARGKLYRYTEIMTWFNYRLR